MKKKSFLIITLSLVLGFALARGVLAAAFQAHQGVSLDIDSESAGLVPNSLGEPVNLEAASAAITAEPSAHLANAAPPPGLTSDRSDSVNPMVSARYQNSSRLPDFSVLYSFQDEAALASLQIQVNYAHDWVAGDSVVPASVVITLTDGTDTYKDGAGITSDGSGSFFLGCNDWDSGNCPDILPGDNLYAAISGATAEISPIGSVNGVSDEVSDVVTGTLNVEGYSSPLDVGCMVWEDPPSDEITETADPNGGTFICDFGEIWDLLRGQNVALYYSEPDGDMVFNILTWPSVMANYAHDWVGANYPAGHTFWYTVTDDLGGYKSGGSGQTEYSSGWGGDGFSSEFWEGEQPDIVPGDYVYFAADDGYSNVLEVGEVNGNLDVDNDILTGTILAPIAYSLTVECHPWGAWDVGLGDVPFKDSWAEPDGSKPYSCEWDPYTEWDIQPGQDIAVMYIEPDDDRVINVFREPAAYLQVNKEVEGEPGEDGNFLFHISYWNQGDASAENVVITDTLFGGMSYLADTSGLPHTGVDAGPLVWQVGTLGPDEKVQFDLYVAVTAASGEMISNTIQIDSDSYSQGDAWEREWVWEGQVVPNNTHLDVNKEAWTGDPTPDNDFIFAINVCNHGNTASTEVTLSDQLAPSMEVVNWWSQHPGWYELYIDPSQIELANPSIPGGSCSQVYLRVYLPPGVETGFTLTNTAVITASNDIEADDNEGNWEGTVNDPHVNMGIDKRWSDGQLVPGGELNYIINYYNSGNVPVGSFWITDTLPVSTTFVGAWLNDPAGSQPFEPFSLTGNDVVWQIPELENGFGGEISVKLAVDPGAQPGETLLNEVAISSLPDEDTYEDNSATWIEELFPAGPNLRISKWHNWNEDWQLNYNVRFENIGDQPVNDVWITDTLPLGTSWDGWWQMELDDSRINDFTHTDGTLVWNLSEINPGEMAWLYFNTNLDNPGAPLQWYTNTVEITIPPGDPSSVDNSFEDVAFSGGELRRVEFWLNREGSSSMWGEAIPNTPVTVTTDFGEFYAWADPGCGGCWNIDDAGPINPDDVVTVTAGAGLQPVVVTIPNPIDVEVDTVANQVFGQIGGWFDLPVEVHGEWDGGYQETLTNGGGEFLAEYPDVPPGGGGYIRFIDEIDYAEVIYHRPFIALDLVLEINYGHDWVQGYYEPGHTLWITATESDGVTVKGLAELETGEVPWFEGETGFSTDWGGWLGDRPDLQPGDWVFGLIDDFEATVELGDITITVDTTEDIVDGAIKALWNPSPIQASCEIWAPGGPAIEFTTPPDGSPFQCDFGAMEWQIEPGQTVAIAYRELDGHRIINTYDFPHMAANIGPWSDGNRHVFGDRTIPGSSIALTITTELGAYVASTVVQSDPEGNFNTENNFSEGSLAFWNIIWGDFGGGITDTLQVYPMGGEANPDTDVVTVTAAGPPFFSVGLEYCWLENCDWIEIGEIGGSGVVTINLMAEREFDIRPGTSFHAHLSVWNGHEVIYSWGLPAPELGVWKWSPSGNAQPGGVMVYGVQFRNDGTGPAEDVLIVDTLPISTTYAGDTSGYPVSGNPNQISWDVGTVEAGEQVNFFVTLDVDADIPIGEGSIDPNCLAISTSTEGDWNPENDQFCADPVDVWGDEVEIGVYKWSEPNDPASGQEYNYIIEWCNNRGAAAGPVVLTDTLPAEVTLLEWGESQPWMHFWSEVSFNSHQLVLYAPGLPGDRCENVNLRVALDPEMPLDTPIENLVEIDVAEDVDTENNWFLDQGTFVSWPRYDLAVGKGFHNANLIPGGYIVFWVDYSNHGNTATGVTLTDTLPTGLVYQSAWWGGGTPFENEPLPDPTIIGNRLVWDLGELEVNGRRNFNILAEVEPGVQPPAGLENCAEISANGPDVYFEDNTACYTVVIQSPGPNLMVEKWHEWHGESQLGYSLHFSNVGDQPVNEVWITDTLPMGTSSNGEFDLDFENQRLIDFIQNLDELVWVFDELRPGENGWLYFNLDLNEPGAPLQWYTNTVDISLHPEDPDPGNNHYENVAFSGGEVRQVHIWLSDYQPSSVWGEAVAGSVVTVTTDSGEFYAFASPDCGGCWGVDDAGSILPGEQVEVVAGEGLQPVLIDVPTPFTAVASSRSAEVWGQIDHLDGEWIAIDLFGGPTIPTQTDNDGLFTATFPDIPGDGEGQVRYGTEVDFAEVIFHRHWVNMDLFMDVNYGHDWVQGSYEAGHTVWITVTESDTSTVKGTIELTTGPIPWWGGENGFHTTLGSWAGDQPDIVPGDWIFGKVDNGITSEVHVGAIQGVIEVDTDSIAGELDVPWYIGEEDTLDVECEPWGGGPGAPVKYSTASPDGLLPYYCEWNPATEWDILVGQELAVAYREPDGDRVMNVFIDEGYLVFLPLAIR